VTFNSRWGGEWRAITYRNRATGTEQIALVKGVLDPEEPTLVRMHAISALTDIFAGDGQGMDVLERSMRMIAEEGAGVVIAINRQRDDRFSMALKARAGILSPSDMEELRDYGVGAMILTELGVERMILLTNTHRTLVALSGYGLAVVGERSLMPTTAT
jgi:3,4-dihydroxy 2-butanone 4-phosphate synthase/GTP cyclohydrolase II